MRTYVRDGTGQDLRRCGRCGELKPLERVRLAPQAQGQRDNYCRPCRSRLRPGALRSEQAALHRPGAARKQERSGERDALPARVLQDPPMHRLRRARSGRPRVRPPHATRSFDIGRALALPELAEHPRRDREVRGRLRELPSATHGTSSGALRLLLPIGRWLESGRPDSNRHCELGRLLCNRYTSPARSADYRCGVEGIGSDDSATAVAEVGRVDRGACERGQPGLEPGIAGFGDRCLIQFGHCPRRRQC